MQDELSSKWLTILMVFSLSTVLVGLLFKEWNTARDLIIDGSVYQIAGVMASETPEHTTIYVPFYRRVK